MDALEEIKKHRAYKTVSYKDREIWRRRMDLLWLVDEMKSLVAMHNFTERLKRTDGDDTHYKECFESLCKDCSKHDHYGAFGCDCRRLHNYKNQVLKLLEEINTIECEGSLISRLTESFRIAQNARGRRGVSMVYDVTDPKEAPTQQV